MSTMAQQMLQDVEQYEAFEDFKEWFPKHLQHFEMGVTDDPRDNSAIVTFRVPFGSIRIDSTGGEHDLQGFFHFRKWKKMVREARHQLEVSDGLGSGCR